MSMNIPLQPTPTSYQVVQSSDRDAFEREVNELLRKGWTFHGPTMQSGTGPVLYTQPMIQLEMRPIKMPGGDGSIVPVEGIIR